MRHTRRDRILALFLALILALPLAVPAVHADDEQEQPPVSEATAPAGTEAGEPQEGLPEETADTQSTQAAEQTTAPATEPSTEPTEPATQATEPVQAAPMMDEPAPAAEGGPSVTFKGTANSWGRYCVLPGLDFTNTEKVDITVKISSTVSKSATDVEPGEVAARVEALLGGELGDIYLTLYGTNGEEVEASYTYGHVMGGRSDYTVPATCSTAGYTVSYYMCPSCDQPFGERRTEIPVDDTKHQYVDVAVKCNGETEKVCKLCGKNEKGESVNLDGTGHVWVDGSSEQDCENDTATWQYCQNCHTIKPGSYQMTAAATGHRYGFWKTTQQPDCTTPGVQEAHCMNPGCKSTITKELPVQHSYGTRRSLQGLDANGKYDATCTTASASGYVCKICGAINPRDIRYNDSTFGTKALGHDYQASQDCTQEVTCNRCGEKVEAFESHDLKWSYGDNGKDSKTHEAKCTRNGCTYTVAKEEHTPPADYDCTKPFTCAECGKYVDAQYKNHVYGANEYVDENYHVKKCTHPGCNASIEGAHSPDDGNCATEWKCKECGQVLKPAESHQWGPYVSSGGYHYKVCQNDGCGQTTSREAHTPDSAYGVDYDCTKGIHCRDCGAMMVPAAIGHNTYGAPILGDAEGHYQQCQTRGCTSIQRLTGPNANHTGGEATCQTPATCTVCHQQYGSVDMTKHTRIVVVNEKAATFTEKGYTGDRQCADCHTIVEKGKEIPTLTETCSHQYKKVSDDAACWDQCTICGLVKNRIEHTLEPRSDDQHHWKQCKACKYETTKVPHTLGEDDHDCTTALKCAECGYELEAAKTSHQYGDQYAFGANGHWHVCTNPDCEKTDEVVSHVLPADDGNCTTAVVCQVCGYIATPALEHIPSSVWASDGEQHYQSCLNEGCKVHLLAEAHTPAENDYLCTTPEICAVCQAVLKAGETDHHWSGKVFRNEAGHWHVCSNSGCTAAEPEVPHTGGKATCTHLAECEVCGTPYGELDSESHGATKLVGHVNPTAEAEGYSGDQVCQDCGAVIVKGMILARLDESKAACAHENAHTVYEDAEKHWKVCGDCGAWFQEEPHKFNEGTVTVEPRCTAVGQRERTCIVCGRKTTEEIPKTAHTYKNGICTACGAVEYNVSGGGTWNLHASSGGMGFRMATDSGNFAGYNMVRVNGFPLQAGTDYTFDRATGALVLTDTYLNTLEPGTYQLEVEYVDGTAVASFQVASRSQVLPDLPGSGQGQQATTAPTTTKPGSEASDVPKTGDSAPLPALLALCVLSGGAAVCLLPGAARRRKKN